MKLQSSVKDETLIVEIQGDLIGENSGAEIVGYINDKMGDKFSVCALELSNVRYMNSSGIGVLIALHTKLANKQGVLILVNPSEQINKLLEITKLTEVFKIVDSKDKL